MSRILISGMASMLFLCATAVEALTYQPMLDDDLLGQSPVVVRGEILSVPAEQDAMNANRYQVYIHRVYKGQVPSSEITLVLSGGSQAMGGKRYIPGLPVFAPGTDVVLFLAPTPGGEYRPVHLSLGAFMADMDVLGNRVFRRQLDEARVLPLDVPSRSAVSERPRPAEQFLAWLGEPSAEYAASTLNIAPSTGTTQKDEFTTLGTPPSRWRQFDSGSSVTFRAHASGQPGMEGGGFGEFQAGIAAWVDDQGSNVRYTYGGTTNASAGLNEADGVNAILFNDPNGEVEGSFSCTEGGVLAIGGFVTSGNTQTFNGQVFDEIQEGDIVTNNGAGCFFGMSNNSNGEEVFAHELGHTLGLGHSCEESGGIPIIGMPLDPDSCDAATPAERNALMKATPHADGRGASLGSDDREGIAFLYPNSGSTTPDPDPSPDPDPTPDPGPGNGAGDDGSNGGNGGGGGGCTLSATAGHLDIGLVMLIMLSSIGLFRRMARIQK